TEQARASHHYELSSGNGRHRCPFANEKWIRVCVPATVSERAANAECSLRFDSVAASALAHGGGNAAIKSPGTRRDHPGIDEQVDAGDRRRAVRGEEFHAFSNLVRLHATTERHLGVDIDR